MRSHALAIGGYTSTLTRMSPRAMRRGRKRARSPGRRLHGRPRAAPSSGAVGRRRRSATPEATRPQPPTRLPGATAHRSSAGQRRRCSCRQPTRGCGRLPTPRWPPRRRLERAPIERPSTARAEERTQEKRTARTPAGHARVRAHCGAPSGGAESAADAGWGAVSVGSVPAKKTSSMTSASSGYGSLPVLQSMATVTTPGGREKSARGLPSWAALMNAIHAGSAVTAPCSVDPSRRPSS